MIFIPVTNDPSQQFEMEIEERVLTFLIYYNSRGEYYSLDLLEDDVVLVQGIKMVSMLDLLNGLNILDGDFFISADPLSTAKIGDWGVTHELFYLDADELEEIGIREYASPVQA